MLTSYYVPFAHAHYGKYTHTCMYDVWCTLEKPNKSVRVRYLYILEKVKSALFIFVFQNIFFYSSNAIMILLKKILLKEIYK